MLPIKHIDYIEVRMNDSKSSFFESKSKKGADWITPVGLFAWAKMK